MQYLKSHKKVTILVCIFAISFAFGFLTRPKNKEQIFSQNEISPTPLGPNIFTSTKSGISFEIPNDYELTEETIVPPTEGAKGNVRIIIEHKNTEYGTIYIEKNPTQIAPAKIFAETNLIIGGHEIFFATRLYTYAGAIVDPGSYSSLTPQIAGSMQSSFGMKSDGDEWTIYGPLIRGEDYAQKYDDSVNFMKKFIKSIDFL